MLMGRMMAMIQGRREAEDDEHTEVSALKTFLYFFFKKTEYDGMNSSREHGWAA